MNGSASIITWRIYPLTSVLRVTRIYITFGGEKEKIAVLMWVCLCFRTTSQAIRRTKRDSKQKATSTTTTNQDDQEEQDQDSKEADAEGLALLIPDIQATANLVQDVLSHLHDAAADDKQDGDDKTGGIGAQLLSNEEKYLAVMKPLQFGKFVCALRLHSSNAMSKSYLTFALL